MKIHSENKWCTPAPEGFGASKELPETTPTTEPAASGQQSLVELIDPLLGGTNDFYSRGVALKSLIGAADAK